jgi:hypothetical protein
MQVRRLAQIGPRRFLRGIPLAIVLQACGGQAGLGDEDASPSSAADGANEVIEHTGGDGATDGATDLDSAGDTETSTDTEASDLASHGSGRDAQSEANAGDAQNGTGAGADGAANFSDANPEGESRSSDAGASSPDADATSADAGAISAEGSVVAESGAPDVEETANPTALLPDASLPPACAAGPTIFFATGDGGGGPWPQTLTNNEASWVPSDTSDVVVQLSAVTIPYSNENWAFVMEGPFETPIVPGHYVVPSLDGIFANVEAAGWPCGSEASPVGTVDVFALATTGGDEGALTNFQVAFDLQCNNASSIQGCINYSSIPAVPPPDPASDPSDPLAGCGGSAVNVLRVGGYWVTNAGANVDVQSYPGDIQVFAGSGLSVEIVAPPGGLLNMATYGPDAGASAAPPTAIIAVVGDVQCMAATTMFTIYKLTTDATGAITSLAFAYDCGGFAAYTGCVRYQE